MGNAHTNVYKERDGDRGEREGKGERGRKGEGEREGKIENMYTYV